MSNERHGTPRVGRRDALKIGGLTVSLAALVAACGDDIAGPDDPGRVGYAPAVTDPPEYAVDDAVLLRTTSSIELTAAYGLEQLLAFDDLDAEVSTLIERFIESHRAIAAEMGELTVSIGGQAWECTNEWMMDRLIEPLLESIEASDLQHTNIFDTAVALENWTAATNQSFTTQLTDNAAAEASLAAAVLESRQSAALVATVRGDEGYVSPALGGGEAAVTDEGLPQQFSIAHRFGATGPIELIVGPPNENGVRQTYLLQTPSLNSYVYNELEPTC